MNGVLAQVASGALVLVFATGLLAGRPQLDRRLTETLSALPVKMTKATANFALTDRLRALPQTVW